MCKKLCKVLMTLFIFSVMFIICQMTVFAVSPVTNYVKDTDIVIIAPAENYIDGNPSVIPQALKDGANGWTLTIQNNNSRNGDDLQMWQFGVSGKLRIWDYDKGTEKGYFRLNAVNWRETPSDRFVDIEGRSKKDGANVHVWSSSKDNIAKWFCLVEDGDGDSETFFIYNKNSGKYLAPENFFDTNGKKWSHYQCLAKGKNTVLSSKPFRWRIEVVNNTPQSLKNERAWLTKMDDKLKLSAINIPGTHDSATANVEGSWNEGYNIVACQKYFIQEQLNVGARAFDLRICKKGNKLVLVHGSETFVCHTADTSKNSEDIQLEYIMDDFKKFLKENPDEMIIAIFKCDAGSVTEAAEAYKKVIENYKDIIYDCSKTDPSLGDVRGKIVPFSRISGANGGIYGYNLTQWDNRYNKSKNKYAQMITDEQKLPHVFVQDNYETYNSDKKEYIYETIKNLNSNNAPPIKDTFVFNYTSCEFPFLNTPLNAARNINEYLINPESNVAKYFNDKKRTGIVMMDYIDEMMCKRIINSNPSSYLKNNIISLAAEDTQDFDIFEKNGYKLKIKWPHINDLTYGYTLNDVGLNDGVVYAIETNEDGNETIHRIDGAFAFTDGLAVPSVMNSENTKYELKFIPLEDKYETVSTKKTIKINKCPISVSIGNYQQQYGNEPDTWRSIIQVVGRIADKDVEKLCGTNMIITKDGKEYNLLYTGDIKVSDILSADTPVGSHGTIKIEYDGNNNITNIADRFPNYDVNFDRNEEATWEIIPREIILEWSGVKNYLLNENVDIRAEIKNAVEGDDVSVIVKTGIIPESETNEKTKINEDTNYTTYAAIAELEGEDAANYIIPDYMDTVNYTVSSSSKDVYNPQIRLSQSVMEYTGKELRPEVLVFDNDILIPSEEYNVNYSNNIECGFATVTISNKEGGSYNIISKNYDINDEVILNNCSVNFEIIKNLPISSCDSKLIEATKRGNGSVNIKITNNDEQKMPSMILYQAIYDENGILTSIFSMPGTIEENSVIYQIDPPTNQRYKFMIWDENLKPIINFIDETSEWFKG